MPKLTERQFYCVSCRKRVTMPADDICVKVFANKRMYDGKAPALRSQCSSCGTNLTKFIPHDSTAKMTTRYGKC